MKNIQLIQFYSNRFYNLCEFLESFKKIFKTHEKGANANVIEDI